ncbi:MAG: FTR1 family protein [Pseudomonadota bacterium]
MISAALIVLREVFEAALLIGILLAGTREVAGRSGWVAGGVGLGLLGATAVALGAGRLAEAFEGSGQELFNAVVLLTATVLLGWHSVWMQRHGRQMAQQLAGVGRQIAAGDRPLSGLMLVVALAVLREGAELVLFLYGVVAGGTDRHALLSGSALGLAAGVGIGAVVYRGLLKVPQRHLFSVTGSLLLLLAAGMASQAAGNLVQAGWLPPLLDPAWDSSFLLREHSVVGQTLHALIGYVERPSAMQLLFFVVALATLFAATRATAGTPGARPAWRRPLLAAVLLLVAFAVPQRASAALSIYSPVVEAGERAIELRSQRELDSKSDANGAEEHKLEIEYAPTDWWRAEGLVTIQREPAGGRRVSEYSFENVFALAPQGRYWADVGLLAEYAHGVGTDGHDAIELGLLAETAWQRTVLTVNLTAEQSLTGGSRAELAYAARLRWRGNEHAEPGIEIHGELGTIGQSGSLRAHPHQAGPALLGRWRLESRRAFRYEVALLFGMTGASPDATGRLQLEYEF